MNYMQRAPLGTHVVLMMVLIPNLSIDKENRPERPRSRGASRLLYRYAALKVRGACPGDRTRGGRETGRARAASDRIVRIFQEACSP